MKTDGQARPRAARLDPAPASQAQQQTQKEAPEPSGGIDVSQQRPAPVDPGTLPPVVTPPGAFSADELKTVAAVGGQGMIGTGALTGRLELMDAPGPQGRMVKTPTLVTANPGLRSAVRFALDLPASRARPHLGQSVTVDGTIDKRTDFTGRITGAKLGEVRGHEKGSFLELQGTASARSIMGIGGEAPPSGIYLELDRPVLVDGAPVREVFVDRDFDEAARGALDGQPMKIYGQLGTHGWGGVETEGGSVTTLDRSALVQPYGEPTPVPLGDVVNATVLRFENGAEARTVMLARREAYDGDNTFLALGDKQAFVGRETSGMAGDGRFGGFVGAPRPITSATDADRRALVFAADGTPSVRGRALERGAHRQEQGPGVADGMASTWWVDKTDAKAYEVLNGGVAGFANHVASVVDLAGVDMTAGAAPPPPFAR